MAKKERDPRLDAMRATCAARVDQLWLEHEERFMEVLRESEGQKVTVNFAAHIDFSQATASVETKIGFSETFKDKRLDEFDDPNQTTLPLEQSEMAGEPEPAEPKRGRGRPRKSSVTVEIVPTDDGEGPLAIEEQA